MLSAIDSRIQSFVQDWIADPLQWSGICLDWQVRGACIGALVGWLAGAFLDSMERDWVGLVLKSPMVAYTLWISLYGLDPAVKLMLAKAKTDGIFWFSLLVFSAVSLVVAFNGRMVAIAIVEASLGLRYYLLRCKPKPPAANLKAVMGDA